MVERTLASSTAAKSRKATLAGTELHRIVDSGTSKYTLSSDILDYVEANIATVDGALSILGITTIGVLDDTPGRIHVAGGGATEPGGTIRLYQASDDDATAAGEYFEMLVGSGVFVIQRQDGTDALQVNADCTLRLPQTANGMALLGDSGELSAGLTTATDVSGSRAANTTYQNTTGVPLFVNIGATVATTRDVEISSDNFSSSQIVVGRLPSAASCSCGFWVPDDWYYRINGTVSSITAWTEYS